MLAQNSTAHSSFRAFHTHLQGAMDADSPPAASAGATDAGHSTQETQRPSNVIVDMTPAAIALDESALPGDAVAEVDKKADVSDSAADAEAPRRASPPPPATSQVQEKRSSMSLALYRCLLQEKKVFPPCEAPRLLRLTGP